MISAWLADAAWTFRYRGDPITVVWHGWCLPATIRSRDGDLLHWKVDPYRIPRPGRNALNLFPSLLELVHNAGNAHTPHNAEGTLWAHGHHTEAANALRAATALADDPAA